MREFKFRAWHKNHRIMLFIVNLTHPIQTPFLLCRATLDNPCHSIAFLREELSYPMQFTGLLDKNGKEIYEGDIGYYPYDSEYGGEIPKGKNLWEVRWEGDMYMLYRGEEDHARYTGDGNCGDDPHYNKWEEFEIKGNIYENPELMEY